MIEIIEQTSRTGKRKQDAHPQWEAWFEASAYTPEVARKELGMANGTFYRRIKSAPDTATKLADFRQSAWTICYAAREELQMIFDCTHQCQRMHAHCQLQLSRSIAPDHFWFWCVTMPDGHSWEFKGGMTFDGAVESMRTEGIESLLAADKRWRDGHAA